MTASAGLAFGAATIGDASTSSTPPLDDDLTLREQLSSLRGLLALSMLMTERRQPDEIIHLAATAVPALVAARTLGAHLTFGEGARWHETSGTLNEPMTRADVLSQLQHLPGSGGELSIADMRWAWAFGLLSPAETVGYLIVTADHRPEEADLLLLRSLAQQTGIALANARLHTTHSATHTVLNETINSLRNKTAIHDRFTKVALAGGGQQGVVDALFELTGLPASIEDRSGKVVASAGPPGTQIHRATFSRKREQVWQSALRSGHPIRVDDRLLTVVRPHPDVLGVLMLVDPGQLADDHESVALEHAATVLAIELARLHGLAETELRLGRNLVADLISGAGDEVFDRAQALGHDLGRPHRVIMVSSDRRDDSPDEFLLRVRESLSGSIVATGSTPPPLLMPAGQAIVALVPYKSTETELLSSLLKAAGRGGRIGVGGICRKPTDFPRSHREAQLALRVSEMPRSNSAILRYDDLGVYQLLSENSDPRTLQTFVQRWLGSLIDYDADHESDLTETLSAFLDVGGNYDATAQALHIGRSTVRYRIRRIQQITGHDLSDPEVRFQVQLAVRAWATVQVLSRL